MNDDETIELWRRAMASAPAELRRASLLNREDCDELIGAVASRLGDAETTADIRAGVLVRAAVSAVEYAYEWWLTYDQSESLHALTERALQLVTNGLGATRRRPPDDGDRRDDNSFSEASAPRPEPARLHPDPSLRSRHRQHPRAESARGTRGGRLPCQSVAGVAWLHTWGVEQEPQHLVMPPALQASLLYDAFVQLPLLVVLTVGIWKLKSWPWLGTLAVVYSVSAVDEHVLLLHADIPRPG